jgi:hypothetical protein
VTWESVRAAPDPAEPAPEGELANRASGDTPGQSHSRSWRLSPALIRQLVVGLFLLLCFGFFHQVPIWNEPSRYDLVVAIVDDHTTQIDRNQSNTGDKAFYKGHYYSEKEPGSALLGIPAYALMRLVRSVTHQPPPDSTLSIQVLAFVVCGIPTALLAMLLIRFLGPLVGEWWAIVVAAGYALGTEAFPFATMYFGHASTTFFLFASFYLLRRWVGWPVRWRPALAGLCAGVAVLVDLSAAIGVIALIVYASRYSFRRPFRDNFHRPLPFAIRTPLLVIAGAVPAALVLFAYNWVSFGSPLSLGYAHEANSGFAAQSQGILGVTVPRPSAIGDILFGTRGLLRYSPWLALAPAGLWAARRRPDLRWEIGVCGVLVAAYILVNGGYYLPFGGATPGPRFLMPMLPFAAVLVALAPRRVRYLAAVLIVPSIALTTLLTATMPNALEGVANPLTDLWLPMFRGRFLAETTGWLRWGLHGGLPLVALGLGAVCAGVAVWATTHAGAIRRRVGIGAGVVLGVLVGSLGTPLDAPSEFGLTTAAHWAGIGDNGAGVTIVDTGVTAILTSDGHTSVRPWAEIEGRDAGARDTRVVFTVFDALGKSVFGVLYSKVDWGSYQRKMLPVAWSTKGVTPGVYSLTVSVTSGDGATTYATVADGSEFTIPPGYQSGQAS